MEYRKLDKLGIETSLLGFGAMRFPTKDGKIEPVEAEQMIDAAIAAGVNYIDTAYVYHDGESERFVGKAIKKYDRKKLYIATKLPNWQVNSIEDVDRIVNDSLKKLDTDYIDFYLLHSMGKASWEKFLKLGVVDRLKEFRAQGKIKYIGFSFHDEYAAFEEMVGYGGWDFLQIQLNYIDTEIQAGIKGYELAVKNGIPVIVMEPIKGGSLATLSDDITGLFKAYDPAASVASWALRYVASLPGVKVVLSGMSTLGQTQDNLATFEHFKPLNEDEKAVVAKVVDAIKGKVKVGCTGCRYCMPCPFGVDIPRCFGIINNLAMYANEGRFKWEYYNDLQEPARADKCQQCGACETHCPQSIAIREALKDVAATAAKIGK